MLIAHTLLIDIADNWTTDDDLLYIAIWACSNVCSTYIECRISLELSGIKLEQYRIKYVTLYSYINIYIYIYIYILVFVCVCLDLVDCSKSKNVADVLAWREVGRWVTLRSVWCSLVYIICVPLWQYPPPTRGWLMISYFLYKESEKNKCTHAGALYVSTSRCKRLKTIAHRYSYCIQIYYIYI